MIALLAAHRLWILGGSGLVALGVYVVLHPELFRGASLILIGLAALERGSSWVRRMLAKVSTYVSGGDGGPDGGARQSSSRRWTVPLGTRLAMAAGR